MTVPPIALTFGLYQGTKLSTAALDSYTNALDRLLLPRLLSRLERQIAAQMDALTRTLRFLNRHLKQENAVFGLRDLLLNFSR